MTEQDKKTADDQTGTEQGTAEDSDDELDLWAAAMAEQESQTSAPAEPSTSRAVSDEPADDAEDLWAAAMAEQADATPAEETSQPASHPAPSSPAATAPRAKPQPAPTPPPKPQVEAEAAGERVFRPLTQSADSGGSRDLEMILDIPVRLSVELGRTKVTIKQLLEMAQGSVVELDGLAGEPMDILINGYLIAQGEVVVVEDKYGIRITEIVTPSERVQKLNR
jgi:flagellar motor switch protein FliN/FliY